ncbi:MAG TPA: TetR/AcrR family transcriptional regulator [Thermoleophilaceae bacterium]
MGTARLSRKESQARTRELLRDAAKHLFAERGLEGASIDDIAHEAGFTKGAFYANFDSKHALYLELLDEYFADRLDEVEDALRHEGSPEDQARRAGLGFASHIGADSEWRRLYIEFCAHALRDERFRHELAIRLRGLRAEITRLYTRRAADLPYPPPFPLEQITTMTGLMVDGFALEKVLDPEALPDDVSGTMLYVFFTGLRTLAEQSAQANDWQ